jgi:hypothetical protein
MLIYLAEELGAQFAQLSQSVTFGNAMRNLALCEREGKHVLAGSYAVLTKLKKWDELSPRERAVFERCHMEIQTRLQLWKNAIALIEVSNEEAGEIRRLDEEQQLRFVVPYGYFADSARIQPVRLVGENLNDAELYKRAAEVYLHQFGPTGDSSQATFHQELLRLCLNPRGTGGSQLGAELELAAKTEMVLAVADGDIWYPGGPSEKYKTKKGAQDALETLKGQAVAELLITAGRNIENILPDDVILAAHLKQESLEQIPPKVMQPHRKLFADEEARRHLDLKAGLRLKSTQPGNNANEDERRFLEAVAQRLKPEANTANCRLNSETNNCEKKECNCVVVAGYGDKLLERVLAHLTKYPEKPLTLTPELKRIARHVAAFGCAVKPGNANTSILAPRSFADASPEASH